MSVLEGIKGVMGFLTIIPTGREPASLKSAGDHMYMFPLVGGLIGLLAAFFSLFFFEFVPELVVGFLTLGFIFLITGLHHTDGLVDFGDGLMASGDFTEKIQAMQDKNIGTGGFMLGAIVILVTALTISSLETIILEGLVVCEISAKFSMVTGAKMGRSGHEGMNTVVIEAMEGAIGNARFLIGLAISLALVFLMLGLRGFIPLLGGVFTAIVLTLIASRNFNGLTGDVFGAMNDLSRMASLVLLLIII